MSSRPHQAPHQTQQTHHARHLSLGLRMALLPALLAVGARLLVTGVHAPGVASALGLGVLVLLGIALPVDWLSRRGTRSRSARHRSH